MLTNEELLAAAEYVTNPPMREEWRGGTLGDEIADQAEFTKQAELLARHVRESLAGEGEAITEEWLLEIGFEETVTFWQRQHDELLLEMDLWHPDGEWRIFATRGGLSVLLSSDFTTRRQLLSLLSALGIEVTTK